MDGEQRNAQTRLVGRILQGKKESSIKMKASYREERIDEDQRKTDSRRKW